MVQPQPEGRRARSQRGAAPSHGPCGDEQVFLENSQFRAEGLEKWAREGG